MNIALIQCNSNSNVNENVSKTLSMLEDAFKDGAKWVCLPEMFHYRKQGGAKGLPGEMIPGPSSEPFMILAKKYKGWILLGSLCEKINGDRKVYNTSILINPKGKIHTTYRKMHLFDVNVQNTNIQESFFYKAGKTPVCTEIEDFKVGLSVCYDLRFPELYRYYSQLGAKVLCVPSSFTHPTGKVHWEALLRARAIENQCFVLAPNQVGKGAGNIETYGHSMVIDPWGRILAEGSETNEEIVTAKLDFSDLDGIRSKLPSLKHRQLI